MVLSISRRLLKLQGGISLEELSTVFWAEISGCRRCGANWSEVASSSKKASSMPSRYAVSIIALLSKGSEPCHVLHLKHRLASIFDANISSCVETNDALRIFNEQHFGFKLRRTFQINFSTLIYYVAKHYGTS